MPSALSVAKEFVRLAYEAEGDDPVTNLRLQKLLYYAQGWSLAARRSQLFPEYIRGWRNGPVVTEVWSKFTGGGGRQITPDDVADVPDAPDPIKAFVGTVWESYKDYSAIGLVGLTHAETPWKKAWGDRPADGRGNDEVQLEDMEDYFCAREVPAEVRAFERRMEEEERLAEEALAAMPPLNLARFDAAVTLYSASAAR
jgi:uncharacterized phage-associated protein